jgi:hypothetical protein
MVNRVQEYYVGICRLKSFHLQADLLESHERITFDATHSTNIYPHRFLMRYSVTRMVRSSSLVAAFCT